MKKLLTAFSLVLFAIALNAQPSPTDLKGSLNKGKLVLNKKELSKEWKIQPLVDVLGAAERPRDGYNKTHTYDRYGIVGFEPLVNKEPSGNLSELQIYFSFKDVNDVVPKSSYTGSFKIGKVKLVKDITSAELKSKLKGYTETDSFMEHNYRLIKDGLYVYFQFNDAETELIKISIGPDKRGSTK